MNSLLISFSCLLAATKVLIQGVFAKKMAKTPIDVIAFNGMVFGIGALFLVPISGFKLSVPVIVAGFLVAIFNLVYQMAYIMAFSCGSVSLTTMIATTSMIIPIIVSAVIYHESITILRIIGIVVTVAALYFTTERSMNNPNHIKWALYTAMAFIANCCISLTQKVFTKSFASGGTSSFVAVHFAFTAIIALAAYLWLSLKGKKCSYDLSISVLAAAAAIGVVLGGFHLVYTYALSVIDATLLIPMYNGGYTILVTVGSTCLMKEKLSRRQLVSIILGVIAIVLMSS